MAEVGASKPVPKLSYGKSYGKLFRIWVRIQGWVIGTGVHIGDVNAAFFKEIRAHLPLDVLVLVMVALAV